MCRRVGKSEFELKRDGNLRRTVEIRKLFMIAWIASGHVQYFLSSIVRNKLQEAKDFACLFLDPQRLGLHPDHGGHVGNIFCNDLLFRIVVEGSLLIWSGNERGHRVEF